MNEQGPVLLVTKLVTQNQGNQALSIAWRRLLRDAYPERQVVPLERAPSYLKRFTLAQIGNGPDPIGRFEAIARRLSKRAMNAGVARYQPDVEIRHNPSIAQSIRTAKLRGAMKIRSRLSALGLGGQKYGRRLAQIRDAGLLVMNPAGEFFSHGGETVLIYLLELRVAQLLGVPTAIVNLSFELEDPVLLRLSAHVFDKCDAVEFRDVESKVAYFAAGGSKEPVILPDVALLTPSPVSPAGQPAASRIALAINALQVRAAGLDDQWIAFFDRLRSEGFDPVLTSNEWSTDEPFWGELLANDDIRSEGREADSSSYVALLAGYDVVVSSRLHTCILAIVAGTPVVPVETGTFKLTGFFRQIGLDALPIKLGTEKWQDRVIERVRDIDRDRDAAVTRQSAKRDEAVARIRDGMRAMFETVRPR